MVKNPIIKTEENTPKLLTYTMNSVLKNLNNQPFSQKESLECLLTDFKASIDIFTQIIGQERVQNVL